MCVSALRKCVLGSVRTLERDESLNGLEEDADAEGEKEHAIEKGTKQPGALPAKGQFLREV